MGNTWDNSVLFFLCIFAVVKCCVIPDTQPSWSINPVRSSSSPSRITRDVSLSDRRHCGGSVGDITPKTRVNSTQRVDDLITAMISENVDAYIIPSSDQHLSEYVSSRDKRRAYISGFTGSAGTAVVLADGRRALWTDGRYFLEADQQLDCKWLLMKDGLEGVPSIPEWLEQSLKPNSVVGADPKLISAMEWVDYEKKLKESHITFMQVEKNLVDEVWPENEKPPESEVPLVSLELSFAGKRWEDKISNLRTELRNAQADMIIITAMDEIAWLFNLRGGDVPYNPVFRSYAIIDEEKIRLFLDRGIGPAVDLHLRVNQCERDCVEIHNYKSVMSTLSALSSLDNVQRVMLPSAYSYSGGASYAVYSSIPEEKRLFTVSPVLLMKARKNEVEKQGMRNAHARDAVALIDFLSFLDEEIAAGKNWDELSAAKRLEEFRAKQDNYHSPSFNTISAFGSNGAIIHYRPTPQTSKPITNQSLYLLDSGAQYKDGTTDVTRTMHYGTPTDFQVEAYTRVLKGAIDIATVIFPKGTKDTRIDILARRSLYEVGLDYKHGTGHGIGMFLNIHEAPTQLRIYGKEDHELEKGQFFSDEPGYYKEGEFGIRLETIVTVVPRPVKYDDVPMYGLEAVTLVPFEPKLIDISLLNRKQCEFLNLYNIAIREVIGPKLDKQQKSRAKAYMMERTEPIACTNAGSEDLTGHLQREQMSQNYAPVEQSAPVGGASENAGQRLYLSVSLALIGAFLLGR